MQWPQLISQCTSPRAYCIALRKSQPQSTPDPKTSDAVKALDVSGLTHCLVTVGTTNFDELIRYLDEHAKEFGIFALNACCWLAFGGIRLTEPDVPVPLTAGTVLANAGIQTITIQRGGTSTFDPRNLVCRGANTLPQPSVVGHGVPATPLRLSFVLIRGFAVVWLLKPGRVVRVRCIRVGC